MILPIFLLGITLSEAVKTALSKNLTIASFRHSVRSSFYSARANWSLILPRFSADFSWRRQLKVPEVEIAGRKFKAGTEEQIILNFSVSESLPLDGSLIYIKNAGYDEWRSKTADLESIRDNIAFSTANLYILLARLKEVRKIAEENLSRMKKHYEVARSMFSAGLISEVELTRIHTSYLASRVALKDTEIKMEKALSDFYVITGAEGKVDITQSIDDLIAEYRPSDFFTSITDDFDFSGDPEIRAFLWRVSRLENLAKAERGKLFPVITLGFSLLNSFGTFVEQRNIPVIFAGISLNLPAGAGPYFSLVSLMEAKMSLAKQIDEMKLKKIKEIEVMLREFELLREKIRLAEMQFDSAQKSLEYAEELFREGKLTSLDLIDREFQVKNSLLEILSAKSEMLLLMWRYLKTKGKIAEFFTER